MASAWELLWQKRQEQQRANNGWSVWFVRIFFYRSYLSEFELSALKFDRPQTKTRLCALQKTDYSSTTAAVVAAVHKTGKDGPNNRKTGRTIRRGPILLEKKRWQPGGSWRGRRWRKGARSLASPLLGGSHHTIQSIPPTWCYYVDLQYLRYYGCISWNCTRYLVLVPVRHTCEYLVSYRSYLLLLAAAGGACLQLLPVLYPLSKALWLIIIVV